MLDKQGDRLVNSILNIVLLILVALYHGYDATPSSCSQIGFYRNIDAVITDDYAPTAVTGNDFVLVGVVRDADTCAPLADAIVLFDMTNEDGVYDGVHKGTAISNAEGIFVISSGRPGAYNNGVPHIHLFVGLEGYKPITTEYSLRNNNAWGWSDVSLERLTKPQ